MRLKNDPLACLSLQKWGRSQAPAASIHDWWVTFGFMFLPLKDANVHFFLPDV